ncbi:MAG: hypothetical protein LGR52_09815 [Candidatus Thiosymbion ectosymbiont of Robbea hypermnestra]|nr:hypothetical protein [Candidatus Thiosymbion ectosymbiont of Robbea hypermnestra]
MVRTVEATIDEDGMVHLAEMLRVKSVQRALVIILEEDPLGFPNQESLLSEQSLAEDWDQPEEDQAWSYLQSVR